MDIKPPYGYQEIVPLTKNHRVVLPRERKLPLVFRSLTAVPVSYAEFPAAARDYPLVFITGDQGKSFLPMVLLGMENQQNLFAMADNTWDRRAYVPAYVRRYPFCMTRVTVDGKEQPERVACVEKRALSEKGEPLYDSKGNPLPDWEQRQKLLFEYESDLARTEEMCRTLAECGLFEPFTMQAVPNQGQPMQMAGMHRVVEEKLADLPHEKTVSLMKAGILARVYLHLASLANFTRLLDRRAALVQRATSDTAKRDPSKLN